MTESKREVGSEVGAEVVAFGEVSEDTPVLISSCSNLKVGLSAVA